MPRSYGITNAAPWATTPAVGAPGDMYYNTTTKAFFISDGTAWNQVQGVGGGGGGAAYAEVQSTAPNAASPPAPVTPMGLLWVDTSVTAASFIGPNGLPDQGVNSSAVDMNTLQTSGFYVLTGAFTNGPTNYPSAPQPAILEVASIGSGQYIIQRLTVNGQPQFTYTRFCNGGTWLAWQSPLAPKPSFAFLAIPNVTTSGTTASTLITQAFSSVPYAQRVRVFFGCTITQTVATDTFQMNMNDSASLMSGGRIPVGPGGAASSFYATGAYVLPANTADTLTVTISRRAGTGTANTGGPDARFNYVEIETWPVTS